MSAFLVLVILGLLGQAAGTDAPSTLARVGGEIKQPRRIKSVAPVYPEDARRAGLAQDVVIECVVDRQGAVAETKVLSGVPPLTAAALAAVKQWRYEPTLLDGVPVPVIMTVTVHFQLTGVRYSELLKSLRSGNENIREAAARSLGGVQGGTGITKGNIQQTVKALEGLAQKDPSPCVQEAAARSLTRIDGRPLPAGLARDTLATAPAAPAGGDTTPASDPAAEAASVPPRSDAYDRPPRPIQLTKPKYPCAAFRMSVEGTVVIEILIDAEGRVVKSRVVQSIPELDAAALACVNRVAF